MQRLRLFMKQLVTHVQRTRMTGLAAEMSFWLFMALMPLAAMAAFGIARLAMSDHTAANAILAAAPPAARTLIQGQLAQVAAWHGGAVAPMAGLIFLWLASSGIHAIFDAFEVEMDASRPWWKKRLIAIACCLALSVGVVIITVLSTGLSWMWKAAGHDAPATATLLESSVAVRSGRFVIGGLIGFGLVVGIFWAGSPACARKRMPIVPGALVAVGLQVLFGFGYGLYVSRMGDSGAYVAGLAVVGVTLMTLWLLSIALLAGVSVNQALGIGRRRASVRLRLARIRELGHDEATPRPVGYRSSRPSSAMNPRRSSQTPPAPATH